MAKMTKRNGSALRVNRLAISNFMRVEGLQVDLNGRSLLISGKNGQGKTSVVDAIWTALGGKNARKVEQPIRKGATEASITLDLGEYVVERRFNESGSTLVVRATDGRKVASAQKLLDGLLGDYSLDPVAFLQQRPQDQVDTVLGVCGVTAPVDRVKTITGRDHPTRPGESADEYLMRLSGDETGEYYLERRAATREVRQAEAALEEEGATLAELGGPVEEGERSASELIAELTELRKTEDAWRTAKRDASEVAEKAQAARERMADCKRQYDANDERIEALQAECKRLAQANEELEERMAKGKGVIERLDRWAADATAALEGMTDPGDAIAAINERLADVERYNKTLSKRRHAAEQVDALKGKLEERQAEFDRLDGIMTELRGLRANLLNDVDLGVPGLSIDGGKLNVGGVPFSQGSHAERLKVACIVAMKQNPALRLLRVDDGEHLDGESRKMLMEFVEEYGFQVFYTSVSDEEALRVEIVDGDGTREVVEAKNSTEPPMDANERETDLVSIMGGKEEAGDEYF